MEFTIDDVIRFARTRHDAWSGVEVDDPIIRNKKFTNVFRLIDRGSQYLLSLMQEFEDPLDRLALSYFYRQMNRPDTMDDIISMNEGSIPDASDIFNPTWYDEVVRPVSESRKGRFSSGAYLILIIPSDKRGAVDKMQAQFPSVRKELTKISKLTDLEDRVRSLEKVPGIGPFLAMQISTDLGYCPGEEDQENTFVLAGPGSRRGAALVSSKPAEYTIKNFPFDELPPLPESNGRLASWMDIQNVFCEFSKYARFVEKEQHGSKPYQRGDEFDLIIPEHFIQGQ